MFLTAVALVLAMMSVSAWNRRPRAPGAPLFSLLIFSAAIYCYGYAGEVAQTTLSGALFWLHVEYLGIPWIPALWLLGAQKHNGLNSHHGLLFVIPVLTFLGELTNSMHGLYDRSMTLIPRGPFWVVAADRGPIAWLNIAYLNFALLYGVWIYLFPRSAVQTNRTSNWILLSSAMAPLIGYMIYLFGWSPWGLDLAPLTLGVTVVSGYFAVFRLGCFDLIPMSRSLVFNSMRDAVVVADLQFRLVDFNPAASQLLPSLAKAKPGADIALVLRCLPNLVRVLLGQDGAHVIDIKAGEKREHFDVRVVPLFRNDQRVGSAAILANITAQVQLMHELQHKAETDPLTGVANRRCFLSTIKRECLRSVRYREPFSVILVDLDHFKEINDRRGHHAGDRVLSAVSDRILQCLRESDLLSRYGGDEFAILLPKTSAEGAAIAAERIRDGVAHIAVELENETISITVSIGFATHDAFSDHDVSDEPDWGELLKHADKALYGAKANGRNRVAAWKGLPTALR